VQKKRNPPPPGIEPETFRLQDSYEELYNSRTRYQLRHRGFALLDVQAENTLYD
jgi:hypothetical protein